MEFSLTDFPIEIRPIRADDSVRLRASHARLSPESRYRRFLGAKPTLTESDARYLVEVDGRDHVALVATTAVDGADGEIVAVARFVRLPDVPGTAEFAIVVADAYQRHGLATELLRRLAEAAPEHGITRFRATMLSDNLAIQRMLERLALGEASYLHRGSVTELQITLPGAAPLAFPTAPDTVSVAPVGPDTETPAAAWHHPRVAWTLTVRCGPRVKRSRHEEIDAALTELEARGRELAATAPRQTVIRARRFEPAEQVYARLELAGPLRLVASVRVGVDIHGDGSTEAYRGRIRREPIAAAPGESTYAALRRSLAS